MNHVAVALAVAAGTAAWKRRPRPAAARLQALTERPATARTPRVRRAEVAAHLPDAIELVVLAVRAGALPAAAIAAVTPHVAAPIAPAFAAVQRASAAGERFADAVQELPRLLGPPAVAFADSLSAADRDGLPLTPVLDRLAAEARIQRRRHAEALARQLPVRLSLPLVLCTLPSFVLLAVAPLLLAALSSLHR